MERTSRLLSQLSDNVGIVVSALEFKGHTSSHRIRTGCPTRGYSLSRFPARAECRIA